MALTDIDMALVRSDRLSSRTRSLLLSLKARSHAAIGDTQSALRAIGESDDRFCEVRDEEPQPCLSGYYDSAEHFGETGHAFADIARTRRESRADAAHRLRAASVTHGDAYARSQAFCELRLTRLLLDDGEPEEAVHVAEAAIVNVSRVQSSRLALVVRDVRESAATYTATPAICQLRERLASASV